ncbi:ABC transporter permease [Pseudonocardia benzenivorans]
MPTEPYDVRRTMPIRVELTRQLRRRRTQVAFALVVLLPIILWIAFSLAADGPPGASVNLVDLAKDGAANFAVFALFASASFCSSSWWRCSSATRWRRRPVGRACATCWPHRSPGPAVAAEGDRRRDALARRTAAVAGRVARRRRAGLRHRRPRRTHRESLAFWTAVGRVLLGALYLALSMSWVAALALLLSVSTDAPLGAVGGAVMTSIVSQILDQITALENLRDYLPTHYVNAWSDLLAGQVDWGDMTRGVFSSLCFAAVFGALAVWRFQRKDITS